MTNQQGAPEARSYEHQRAIMEGERNASLDAYSRVVYLTQTESRIYEAGFTNGWKRLAAMVEAQQPAAHVQKPAEIEHVAGDVSKNGAESTMAQQSAPSAAAAPSVSDRERALHDIILNRLSHAELLEKVHYLMELNSNQARTIGELQYLVESTPQPYPTPQADSQPAPDNLRALFREALAWGMVYGPEIPAHQWDEMRESMVKQYTSRAARAPAESVGRDAERLDFIERHPEMHLRHRKGKWAFMGFSNYEYDLHPSLRAAIDAAMAANGGNK